jgi:hypothetical protein
MALILTIRSPTIKEWLRIISTRRRDLVNPSRQMWMLLQKTREDVDRQFDENQGSWTPLKPYTIEKKTAMEADMRILHETKVGEGLRLREAYMEAGSVDPYGKLTYAYPDMKPYAKDLQMGVSGETIEKASGKAKRPKLSWAEKKRRAQARKWSRLDDELDERFGSKF